jgi:hypothetical protein
VKQVKFSFETERHAGALSTHQTSREAYPQPPSLFSVLVLGPEQILKGTWRQESEGYHDVDGAITVTSETEDVVDIAS